MPRPKKKRKPKSQRGSGGKGAKSKPGDDSGALMEAMDILNRSQDSPENADTGGGNGDD